VHSEHSSVYTLTHTHGLTSDRPHKQYSRRRILSVTSARTLQPTNSLVLESLRGIKNYYTSYPKYLQLYRRKITEQYIIEHNQYERVNEFTYLGTQINAQNKIIEEIKRIQAGNRCYYENKKLLSNKLLNYNSKIQIYKTIIRLTVTYGCETWVLTTSDKNQLCIFERKILRKIYGPTQNPDGTWRIKTNEELRHRMKKEDIIKFIKSQRLR